MILPQHYIAYFCVHSRAILLYLWLRETENVVSQQRSDLFKNFRLRFAGRCSTNVHIIQRRCNKLNRLNLIAFTLTVVIDVGQYVTEITAPFNYSDVVTQYSMCTHLLV